jgi:hypothetical protein
MPWGFLQIISGEWLYLFYFIQKNRGNSVDFFTLSCPRRAAFIDACAAGWAAIAALFQRF